MAFINSRSGYCISSGPPSQIGLWGSQMCYQTAYVPRVSTDGDAFAWDSLLCTKNGNTIGACSYDAECGANSVCSGGRCYPTGVSHDPWAYGAGNPQVVHEMSWNQVSAIMTAMGLEKEFNDMAQKMAFGRTMYLVSHKGQSFVATPLNVQYFRQDPQCSTCLKSVWQCDRFRDSDPLMYQQCMQLQDSFLFDVNQKSGIIIPLMIKINPVSLQAATAALSKCVMHCGDCLPNTPLSRSDAVPLFY